MNPDREMADLLAQASIVALLHGGLSDGVSRRSDGSHLALRRRWSADPEDDDLKPDEYGGVEIWSLSMEPLIYTHTITSPEYS